MEIFSYSLLYVKITFYFIRSERPTRAYSIGSKVEHIKMSQILGNINEVNNSSPRVRAYSVGSKSKIPRCEIQRGVLFTKVKKGFNHKGSNCNVSMDTHASHDAMGYNNSREMKSTSAPLLNLRHYMNSDRMSDLMEIDFSNATTNSSSTTSTSQEQKIFNNLEIANRTQNKNISNPNFCSNGNIKQQSEMLKKDESSPVKQQQQSVQSFENSADSGYLEMKPVGIINPNSKQASLEDQMKTLKVQSTVGGLQLHPQQQQQIPQDAANKPLPIQALSHVTPKKIGVDTNADHRSTDNSIESSSKATNNVTDNNINLKNTDNKQQKNRLEQLKVDEYTTNTDINNMALDISNTVGRKLIHSLSNEDYSKYFSKSKTDSAAADAAAVAGGSEDVGYQILQIKSDSYLISKKKSLSPHQYYDELLASQLANTKTWLSLKKSEGSTNNNKDAKTAKDTVVKDEAATSSSASTTTATASSSGAPCDHHELHYASLDLPQCSGQITSKCLKKASCESPPVESFESRNSYAKIDFDQSDSSSASSKVCNV